MDLQMMYGDNIGSGGGDEWWAELVALEEPMVERAKELGLTAVQI